MADCKIIYNSNNEKIGVEDANGQSSTLFQEILNNSQVKNFDEALEIYKQTLSTKLKQVQWNSSKGNQRLEGAPIIEGATGADPQLVAVAVEYARKNGINYTRQPSYVEIDEDRAKRIAQAYEDMKHDPQDPKVKEAYQNLINQTIAQYRALEEAGYKFYFFDENNDPYQGNPWNAMRDLRSNKTMGVFATEAGFGSGATELNVEDNPLLVDTGITWGFGSINGEQRRVLANDLFRAVHDAFGHGLEGAGFRARGEENAWQAHVRLFTGSAIGAITSETRGQNSWLNYGKFGEQNKTAKVEDTVFADQKTGLMPEWTWTEGIEKSKPLTGGAAFANFFAKITNTKDGGAKFKNIKEVLNKPIDGFEKELEAYLKYGKNFQKHIMASIPAFVDARIRALKGMVEASKVLGRGGKEVNMLDIPSSEGYFTKAYTQLAQDAGVNAKADALDAGVTFQRDFNEAPQVPGVNYLLQAWGESFTDPNSGINIPLFQPTKKYGIVFEGMGFQFFTPTRDKEIKEVKDMMQEGGLFVTMEKLKNKDYEKREVLKDEFKSQFFTQEEMAQKAATVLKKSDEASVGMMDYQFDRLEYEKVLAKNFKYVVQFYSAGNFAGYYASDNLEVINTALENTGDTTTKFNEEVTPKIIQGQGILKNNNIVTKSPFYLAEGEKKTINLDVKSVSKQVVDLEINKELLSSITPILSELNRLKKEPLIIGGAVRDALIGNKPKDLDIEVYDTTLEELETILSSYGKVDAVGKSFGVLKFTPYIPGTETKVDLEEPFDFSVPRKEDKVGEGHTGFEVEFSKDMSIEEASSRRDFTWNSIGYNPITKTLYDPYNGIEDLKNGVIRHTTDKFSEDPLRIMRAMQFQSRLGHEIAPETYALMKAMVERGDFDNLPTERIREEWEKWAIKGKYHSKIFDFLRKSGLGDRYYPELMVLKQTEQDKLYHPEGNVEEHTMQVIAKAQEIANNLQLSSNEKQILIFSALFHDIAKPQTTDKIWSEKLGREQITSRGHEAAGEEEAIKILTRMGILKAFKDKIGKIIKEHLAHATISSVDSEKGKKSAFAKLVQRIEPASVEQLMLLMEADMLGRNNGNSATPLTILEFGQLLEQYKTDNEGKLTFTPIITGKHLISLGFKPGKEMGEMLATFKEAQLNLEFENEPEALEWLSKYIAENIDTSQSQIKRAFSLNTQEPSLKYQTKDGQIYQSYEEALKNTQGEDVLAGVNTVDGFKEIFSTSSNTNIDTTEGFVNNMVKSDLLTGESYKENGKTHYKAQGKSFAKQKINAENVKDLYQKQFGIKSATINADNTVTINGEETHRNNVQITTKNGEQKVVSLSELNKPFSELKKEYDVETTSSILANNELKNAMARNKTVKEEFIPETELQQKLINLLKKFGIKTLSFEDYLKNYNKRNNLPISARALVDLTEKIIAFKDGIVENDDLVEEVAHLIESSIPMEQKENILRNIHKTQEWMQFAEEYSKIYETEEEVRREILGKVIANSIKEQFANRNTNETENSIIAKIKQFFEDFFNRINSYFKESYKRELENISKNVYKNLMNETLDLDIQQKGIFFSTGNASTASTKIYNTANKILSKLSEQHRELSKKYSNPSDKVLLERTKEYLEAEDEATKIKGIASLIRVTSSQVETLLSATENKAEGEYPLSSEENVIFKNLEDRVRPSLAEVKVLLDPKDKFQAEIIEELSNTTKKLENLVGIVKSKIGLSLDRMVDNIVQRAEMSDKDANLYRRTIKNALVDAQKDTDWLHAHIGSLLLARNPILNIAGNIIERMNYQKNENFLKPTKELTNFLADNNFTQKDWEKIIKDGYIINELDQNLVEKVDKEEKAKIINELISKNTPSIKPVTDQTDFKTYFENLQNEFDKGVVGGLLTSLNQDDINNLQSLYRKAWKNNLKTRTERYFTDSYTKALENHTLKISDEVTLKKPDAGENALDLDAQYRADTTQIRINAGKNLTKSDQAKIKEINKRRQADSNPRGIDGKLLPGIKEVYYPMLGRYIVEVNQYKEGELEETKEWQRLTEQEKENVKTIVGLNMISLINQDFYKKTNQGKEIPDSFMAELKNLTTTEEKLEFLENNAYIGFPDDYYESFKDNIGIVSRLREEGSQEALDIIDSIRTQQAIINRILRINSVFNKPSETNFVEMNEVHKNDIKLAQISLEKLYNDAKSVLPKKDVEEIESSIDNVVNESYYNHLRDSGENELEFISKNVTPSGLVAIETAKKVVAGERAISKGFSNYFSENMSQEEKQRALIKFAQSKLLPYLKRTEPKGYTEALQDVKAGRITVEDFIKRTDVVKISPSFSFYEGIDDNINKQWIKNRDNNKPQWTKDYLKKVANKEYFSFFNLDENGNRSPLETKNKKYWDAREKILEYQDKMIEYNNLTGVQNRYMQPQVRRTDMERVAGTTVKGVKEFFVDMAQFRPEEQETGKMLSDSLHSIPTYYNKPLEEKEELTKNYLYAYMMYGQAASLHKARKENISDMFIIEDVLTASSFENKATESTMAYKMFKNFMEYNFYGVKENFSLEFKAGDRTLDIGKILKSMNSWAKKSNLAGLTVPITNLFQSGTQKFMERVIGETIDSKSANEGNKLFMKYASDATKEVMGFNSKSPLNVIGESLGIYNAVHRFEDSQYSKPVRFLMSANAKLHEAANFPIVMRGVMGIISSYKIVDGKIISYNQFKQKMNALNKKGDIDSEWENYKSFAPYFISAVKDGVLDFSDPKFLESLKDEIIPPPNVELKDYLNDKKIAISVKSLSFIQRIDSQIPMHQKSIAQRDARANFFLSHLGFLLSAIPQRIRSRHYNIAEEAMQEGSWITAKDFLAKIISNPKGYREVYESLDENQKKNLKRVLVELGFANALAFMALMLSRYNDDSDEVLFPVAIADLFLTRVATEQISSTVGLPTTILGVTDNPIMLVNKVGDWARVDKLFGDSEQRNSYLNKLVPFYKETETFSDPIGKRQKYSHFQNNDNKLFYNYAWASRYFKEEN